MCSESCDLFKVWEISDDVLLPVQDGDVAYRIAPVPMPLNDIEGHFC